MRIKKLKIKEQRIHIEYEEKNKAEGWDEFSLTCAGEAAPSFYAALRSLAEHATELCELPQEYVSRIKVKGVSFSYAGDKETMGATIIATLFLNKSSTDLNLNTPHKIEAFYSGDSGDENQLLPDECVHALYTLIQECELYIQGKRIQGALFKETTVEN